MTIESLEDGLTVSFSSGILQYCINGSIEWITLNSGESTPEIDCGYYISFRGNLSSYNGCTFTISKQCNLKGNCMSLLYGDDSNSQTSVPEEAFCKLFYNCTTIKNISSNFLPATTLSDSCYKYMFEGCSSLVNTPELPATTLANNCYYRMFKGCSSLVDVTSKLPAMILYNYCYYGMFVGCESLQRSPELPATEIAEYCYSNMFSNCSILKTVPELPATTLKRYCYREMFQGCSLLEVSPTLIAPSLEQYCYYQMFKDCTNLNYIEMYASNIPSSNCLQ
jgi:hypothetical protein